MAPTPLRWAYAGRDESKHGVQCVLAGDEVLCEEEGDLTTLGKIGRLPPHSHNGPRPRSLLEQARSLLERSNSAQFVVLERLLCSNSRSGSAVRILF